ncbi:MAG TPA: alpha-ketoglutarate-dependent dioxygenase AlkB [Candidatus Baltobacteraceae bacterium]
MAHQLAFFPSAERILARAGGAEVRYVPALFSPDECERYFAVLRDGVAWDTTRVWMYDREVDVPRLVAWYGIGAALPEPLSSIRVRVAARLGADFNSVGMNLYRDGSDSVAWHSDKNELLTPDPTIAVVSFGVVRAMQIRPKAPPRHAISIELEPGSALVMSGNAQDHYEHGIPKTPDAIGPRISVVFRTKA